MLFEISPSHLAPAPRRCPALTRKGESLGRFGTIWGYFGTMWDHLELCGTTWGSLGPSFPPAPFGLVLAGLCLQDAGLCLQAGACRSTMLPSRLVIAGLCLLPSSRKGRYQFVQKKRSGTDLGSNRPSSPRNLESKSFSRSWDRFEAIWIDSETSIFRRFEPGSLSTLRFPKSARKRHFWIAELASFKMR